MIGATPTLPRRAWGLFTFGPRWGLSRRGWLVVTLIVIGAAYLIFSNLYSFLAIDAPVDTDKLVVEGWVHQYAIQKAAAEFYRGHYKQLFTTGGPVIGEGGYTNDYNTAANVGAELLKKVGVPAKCVQTVPSRVNGRERTYSSALALREWLAQHKLAVESLNVLTEDTHARRTRLLFQKALGPEVRVGVIAVGSPDYEANRWWRYSDGAREVIGETIAYLYAKCLFRPSVTSVPEERK